MVLLIRTHRDGITLQLEKNTRPEVRFEQTNLNPKK
jgi:hypothetical protein